MGDAAAARLRPVTEPDLGALRAFYDDIFDEVYRFAIRLTGGDAAAAEDLVHEAFLGLVRAWRDGRIDRLEIGWLITVTRRQPIQPTSRYRYVRSASSPGTSGSRSSCAPTRRSSHFAAWTSRACQPWSTSSIRSPASSSTPWSCSPTPARRNLTSWIDFDASGHYLLYTDGWTDLEQAGILDDDAAGTTPAGEQFMSLHLSHATDAVT